LLELSDETSHARHEGGIEALPHLLLFDIGDIRDMQADERVLADHPTDRTDEVLGVTHTT
jgi:hypothetical protein